jgi:ATP-dependent helicase/DNAse subunit B
MKHIPKTPAVMEKLNALFEYGISPSALTTYIRNPLDFYKRYILRIDELEEIEEEVSYRVYGNILHDTLQSLYEPYVGKTIEKEDIERFLATYEAELQRQFSKQYNSDAIQKGKNLLAFEIAKQQCERFLKLELETVADQQVQIISIEETRKVPFQIDGINIPIHLKGKGDRVDLLDGVFRIVDYKTGKVEAKDLKVESDWENFTEDYKYSKAFQVLFYAVLFKNEAENMVLESGIFSFKNLNEGFLKFRKKIGIGYQTEDEITPEILQEFEVQLSELIKEILDSTIPFQEKEV